MSIILNCHSWLVLPAIISPKVWQKSPVGNRTVAQSNRGRWARRTQTKSPKRECWHQQTVTGDVCQLWHQIGTVPQLNSSFSASHRLTSESADSDLDVQLHCSSSLEAEPEAVMLQPESPPLTSAFAINASFEEDVLDLKWRQSIRSLLCPATHVLSAFFLKVFFWLCCF